MSTDPNICLGQPTIRDTRITLGVILKMLGNGRDVDDVLSAYPELVQEDVEQAIRFADRIIEKVTILRADEAFEAWKQDPDRARSYLAFRTELMGEGLLDPDP